MSKQDTFAILDDRDEQNRRRNLVTKWKSKVTEADERSCFNILSLFEIDAYQINRTVAHDRYLHFPDTLERLPPLTRQLQPGAARRCHARRRE
jgi:hypothetical protein